jgi:hypothetical protein
MMQDSFRGFKFDKRENAWLGTLQPTLRSPKYLVKVTYRPYIAPKVEVIAPQLRLNPEHTFSDGSLCLFFPKDHTWSGENLLSKTILLWTAEWLYCYEIWLASGEWIGKEAPHSDNKSPI